MRAHARYDGAHHAAYNHTCVAQALVDAQLDVFLAEEHWVSTHSRNGGLGGDTSARGPLAKADPDGLASEGRTDGFRLGACFDCGFVGGRILHQVSEFGGGEVCDSEQMAGGAGGGGEASRE
jgi:hypothetical protein